MVPKQRETLVPNKHAFHNAARTEQYWVLSRHPLRDVSVWVSVRRDDGLIPEDGTQAPRPQMQHGSLLFELVGTMGEFLYLAVLAVPRDDATNALPVKNSSSSKRIPVPPCGIRKLHSNSRRMDRIRSPRPCVRVPPAWGGVPYESCAP